MLISDFQTKVELLEYVKDKITKVIVPNQTKYRSTSLFMSGGSSIALYQEITKDSTILPKFLELFQVDERFVPKEDKDSNQKQLLEIFKSYTSENKNFVDTTLAIETSIDNYKNKLKKIRQPDIMVLGFGTDGHFASIFPDEKVAEYLESNEIVIHTQSSSNYPVLDRITLTPSYINKAKKIFVILIGPDKKAILEEFLGGDLPVTKFPAKFWLDNEKVEILTCFE